jgi:hypothetical protein
VLVPPVGVIEAVDVAIDDQLLPDGLQRRLAGSAAGARSRVRTAPGATSAAAPTLAWTNPSTHRIVTRFTGPRATSQWRPR